MRICLVSFEFPPSGGGEATYTRALATSYSKSGHDVTLIVPKVDRPIETGDAGYRVVRVGLGGPIRGARFLAGAERALDKMTGADRQDIVHVTFDYPTFLFHVRRRGVPCVATVHHLHVAEASAATAGDGLIARLGPSTRASVLTWLEGRLLGQCEAVVAVSEYTASTLQRFLSLDPRRLRVVMNGIDQLPFERSDPGAFRQAFPTVKEKAILYVGRLSPSKGVDVLVDAFAKVSAKSPGSSLVFVGAGDSAFVRRLKQRAASLGASDDILFAGRVPDSMLPSAYAAASVTALPSLMEGFGLSVLESMASARPCVATRVGGVPEVLADGKTGLLVPPANVERLASAIGALLDDPGLARRMGEAGRDVARSRFQLERMARETVALYEEVLSGRFLPSANLAHKR